MSDYFECTKVGVEFLEQTKNVFVSTEIIRATPEQIFDVFEDANSWVEWVAGWHTWINLGPVSVRDPTFAPCMVLPVGHCHAVVAPKVARCGGVDYRNAPGPAQPSVESV